MNCASIRSRKLTIATSTSASITGHKVYVMGNVHTNTIEGFWSLVKRGIGGVYHQVSQKYLQSYLNEYSFRYNRRDQGNLIFNAFLQRVAERAGSPLVSEIVE